jgi:mannose-1-phosphate guanylyltransferase
VKAILLAGGLGTRLRPLTYTRPKQMLPIVNRPHIELVLDHLAEHGIDDVVFTTSYLAEAFESITESARGRGMTIAVTREEEPRGTAGALKNAEPVVGQDPFVVINADILTTADLTSLIQFHVDRGAEATILLTPVDDPSRYGVVPTEEDGRVLGFIEKPEPGEAPTNQINAGVYVMEPSVLGRIPEGEVASAERELFPSLVAEGAPLFARATDAYWIDIGTPQSYMQANMDALDRSPAETGLDNGAVVADGGRVSSSCVGAASSVGAGAVVERSILLPGVQVGERAQVRGSILGEGVSVMADAVVIDEVIGDGEVLKAEGRGAG